jgi:protein phosphatase
MADLIRAGELSEEDAQTHPYRYVLTRAIGVIPGVDIDHAGVSCEPGDRLMLCSDGLFKALTLDELKVVLTSEVEPQRSADKLVTSAVEREAEDNVTAMVIDVR